MRCFLKTNKHSYHYERITGCALVCFSGALGGSSKDKRVSCRTQTPLRVLSAGGSRGVMRSGMFSSSVAAVQGMMAWQTRSQMAHLGIPAAAR